MVISPVGVYIYIYQLYWNDARRNPDKSCYVSWFWSPAAGGLWSNPACKGGPFGGGFSACGRQQATREAWSNGLALYAFHAQGLDLGEFFMGRISKETWNLCPNSLVLETHWLTVNQSHYCAQKRTRWTSLRPCLHGANLDPRKLAHMLPLDHGCWLFCILGCSFFGYIPTEAHARWVEGFSHLCSAYILSILLSAGYPWCLQSEFCWSIDKWPKTQICDSPTSDSQIKNCIIAMLCIFS